MNQLARAVGVVAIEPCISEVAEANAARQWVADEIYGAVTFWPGDIVGFLISDDLDVADYTKVGIFVRFGDRQVNIDFIDKNGHGGPHIDFQGIGWDASAYPRLFLQGLMAGLSGD